MFKRNGGHINHIHHIRLRLPHTVLGCYGPDFRSGVVTERYFRLHAMGGRLYQHRLSTINSIVDVCIDIMLIITLTDCPYLYLRNSQTTLSIVEILVCRGGCPTLCQVNQLDSRLHSMVVFQHSHCPHLCSI